MSSQIFGAAVVSPPVLELSGNRAGIFPAASTKVTKIAFALARSNGASPLTIAAPILAWSPLAFISALRAAIGSDWAATAVIPTAMAETASTARSIIMSPLWFLGPEPTAGQHRRQGVILDTTTRLRGDS